MDRREILCGCAVALTGALAGCGESVRWYVADERPNSDYVEKVLVGAYDKQPLQSYVYLVMMLRSSRELQFPVTFRVRGPNETVPGNTIEATSDENLAEVATTWENGTHELTVSHDSAVLEQFSVELRKQVY